MIALVVKTNQGAMWVIPQIEALLAKGNRVVAVIPEGDGRLRTSLDKLANDEPKFAVEPIGFDFSIGPRLATIRGIWKLRRVLKQWNVSVAFYHLYASALACRAATIFTRIRTVHMVAGPLYLENRLISVFERYLQFRDDRIIAGSRYTYEKYRAIGTSSKKLAVVPYGVDLVRFHPDANDPNIPDTRDPAETSEFTVVMVAYFYAPKQLVFSNVGIKGHELAIEAWRGFSADKEDVRLIFVGSGFGEDGDPYREHLQRTSTRMGLEQSIHWVDTVEDVRSLYKSADLSISPSLSDNHGAVLEASAMAVPSVVSSAGALSEAVSDKSGWVFESGDSAGLQRCIEQAYSEWKSDTLHVRGVEARNLMVSDFDIQRSAERICEVIGSTLKTDNDT